ncbi:Retrovirus-related Pol polyprotein from transposon 17.6, partial [Mucuna pruriens]
MFEGMIGADVEVYVDDMVVKSTSVADHCKALGRVFQILRKHQLKLNPEKCSFEVQAGKILGFMLTKRGIEANSEKCQAIINIGAATDRKDHDTFTIFIPVSQDDRPHIQYPKKGRRLCVDDRERGGFLEVEGNASHPPILTKPTPEIPFVIYILVAEEAVSTTMVQEREGKQYPICFISKILQDAERRYQRIEKATLTLVITSRRLSPYFQGHLVIVRTDPPIKQVLRKPDLGGRMVAWSVQLSEFDILYESRGHIKAQALADFVREMTTETSGGWLLSVDGASNQAGSGAGVILEGPNGVLIEQSLHFEFKANNN